MCRMDQWIGGGKDEGIPIQVYITYCTYSVLKIALTLIALLSQTLKYACYA